MKMKYWKIGTKSLLVNFKVSRKFLRFYLWAIYRRRSKSPPTNQAIKKGPQKVYEHHDASLAKAQKIIPNLVVQNLTKQPMSKSFQELSGEYKSLRFASLLQVSSSILCEMRYCWLKLANDVTLNLSKFCNCQPQKVSISKAGIPLLHWSGSAGQEFLTILEFQTFWMLLLRILAN